MLKGHITITCTCISFVLLLAAYGHSTNMTVQPKATPGDCICEPTVEICSCRFVIGHRLTMILYGENELVYPDQGVLRLRGKKNKNRPLTLEETSRVITADGFGSRLVITVNDMFPGPRVEVYEGQTLEITIVNTMHTDIVSVHFHGFPQRGTPWMDGVAYVTQCPILPGQTFVQRFKAFPPGTSFYHAHVGDQRSMGLYGPLIVRESKSIVKQPEHEIIIVLQDWNHLMDAETVFQRVITQQFDFLTGELIAETYSVDKAGFSIFEYHSGLVNGKGRFWTSHKTNNGAPLERFKVESGKTYRVRVIGAMTEYPMRVFIQGSDVALCSSDTYEFEKITVQSVIVHPGERYDFLLTVPVTPMQKEILFISESIEVPQSSKYHAAEAVLEVMNVPVKSSTNPVNNQSEICKQSDPCVTFNCPYVYYPREMNRTCRHFDRIINTNLKHVPKKMFGKSVDAEYFFNFGYPRGTTSVNSRMMVLPTSSLLTQPNSVTKSCNGDISSCTYIHNIQSNKVTQFVFTNLGSGATGSHPVHLHGHSFFVVKLGFGVYDLDTAVLLENSRDIICTDRFNYCSKAEWKNASWAGGNVPDMNEYPPEKDTIVVPMGGYVVARFMSDNPGLWLLHCHIDIHNTLGMAVIINEGRDKPAAPPGFPVCGNFLYDGMAAQTRSNNGGIGVILVIGIVIGVLVCGIIVFSIRKCKDRNKYDRIG